MRRFVVNMLKILGIVFLFCGLSYQINQKLFKSINPVVPSDKKIVSCGVSFSQFALDDEIIPNFSNLSIKGRTGLGVYKSVQRVVENNPHVEVVVVDFAALGLALYRDYKLFLPVFAPNEFYNVYPITNFKDLSRYPLNYKYYIKCLMRYEWVPNIEYLKSWLYRRWGYFEESFPYIGSFEPRDGVNLDNLEEWKRRLSQMQRISGEEAPLSQVDMTYTDSLLSYLQDNNVHAIIFCPPIHQDALDLMPKEYQTSFKEYVHRTERLDFTDVFDFTYFQLDDRCYFNHTHVNRIGSGLISRAFIDSLNYINY